MRASLLPPSEQSELRISDVLHVSGSLFELFVTSMKAFQRHKSYPPVFFHYMNRKVATLPPRSLEEAENAARRLFKIPDDHFVSIQAIFNGELAEIDPVLFPAIYGTLIKYWVSTHATISSSSSSVESSTAITPKIPSKPVTLNFAHLTGDQTPISFKVDPEMPFSSVFEPLAAYTQMRSGSLFKLTRKGRRIDPKATPKSLQIGNGSLINFECYGQARKPVIYLYPPRPLDVSVNLSLIRDWQFFSVYPIAPIKDITDGSLNGGQLVSWNVSARPDGTMTDKLSGSDVAYLFWEATIARNAVDTPPPSREGRLPASIPPLFNPSRASLDPTNSVLLTSESVSTYLDKALHSLGLHTEARTSFITLWLADMLRHKNIAIRFLNQQSYSAAAPLATSPPADVITRIFMLFCGISDDKLGMWKECSRYIYPSEWVQVVGCVSAEKMRDEHVFRVLEWGGMEVEN